MSRCRNCGEASLVAASRRGLCEDCDPSIGVDTDDEEGWSN